MNIKSLHYLLVVLFVSTSSLAVAQISVLNAEVTESDDLDGLGKVPGLLKWDKVNGASYYEVKISRQESFKKMKLFKLDSKNRFHIRVYPGVDYFWKVKAYSNTDQEISASDDSGFKYRVEYTGQEELKPQKEDISDVGVAEDQEQDDGGGVEASVLQTEPAVAMPEETLLVDDIFKKHKVWLSTEIGPISYKQTNFTLGDLDFDGFIFPTYGLTYQSRKYFDKMYFEASFNHLLSDFELGQAGAVLSDNRFQWSRYAINGFYNVSNWQKWDRQVELHLNLGVERVETPLFDISNPALIDLKSVAQTQLQLGVELRTQLYEGWSYFARGAYFVPLAASGPYSDMSMGSQTAVDLQLGALYYFKENSFLGASVKGNFYKYTDEISDVNLGTFSGERESQFYSTEARVGFSF